VLFGLVIGLALGANKAGGVFDRTLASLTAEHQAFKESLPSENPTCAGKPTPCTVGITPELGFLCATWVEGGGNVVKTYCLTPKGGMELLQIPKPIVPPPKIESDVKT
jgi:hypothetical protein